MSALLFPSMVRDEVLQQHADLRARLEELAEELGRSRSTGQQDDERLRALGRDLCARFQAHMLFEERELLPVLAALDSWGPERVRDIHVAHARQRRKLAALWEQLDLDPARTDVDLALADLADDALRDMVAEEEGCLGGPAMSVALLELV
jgi:hypothetical protein